MNAQLIDDRVKAIKAAKDREDYAEAVGLAISLVHDTSGGAHPIVRQLEEANRARDWTMQSGAVSAVLKLHEHGVLVSPALRIAHEIEGDVLKIAQGHLLLAEQASSDSTSRTIHLAITAALAGATLEDALRRIADGGSVSYDPTNTSLSKLQAALYQPSRGVQFIDAGENKNITAWGETRNNADHGHFAKLTITDVSALLFGTRSFIDKHLP